nr:MAG: internal scaffolding protein [Microvirus sp.]
MTTSKQSPTKSEHTANTTTEKVGTTTAFSPNSYANTKRVRTYNEKSSLTKQSFKAECDINNIINKFTNTGIITHENPNNSQYGYAPSNDFREAMDIVLIANQQFEELPANIRRKFANSPELFLDFAQNPNNRAEMHDMGLTIGREADVQENHNRRTSDSSEASRASASTIEAPNAPDTKKS